MQSIPLPPEYSQFNQQMQNSLADLYFSRLLLIH